MRLVKGGIMIAFLTIGTVTGILLGLRFKILVLIPATLLMTAATTAIGVANGRQFSAVVLTSIGTAVLLQLGYIVGCIFQVMVPAHLPTRSRAESRFGTRQGIGYVNNGAGRDRTVRTNANYWH